MPTIRFPVYPRSFHFRPYSQSYKASRPAPVLAGIREYDVSLVGFSVDIIRAGYGESSSFLPLGNITSS